LARYEAQQGLLLHLRISAPKDPDEWRVARRSSGQSEQPGPHQAQCPHLRVEQGWLGRSAGRGANVRKTALFSLSSIGRDVCSGSLATIMRSHLWEHGMVTLHRAPWNKGKIVGQKAPFKLREIWAIRIRLQLSKRTRELALFN